MQFADRTESLFIQELSTGNSRILWANALSMVLNERMKEEEKKENDRETASKKERKNE